jgi:Fe-S-cluster containining protein
MCGTCCQNIGGSALYGDLDDGRGVCRFFDEVTKLCTVYEKRPLKCRVEDCYETFFMEIMSKDDFYKINYQACKDMQKRRN